ncbi:MAG TPA: uroporphyrinogen-III synthase [Terriglobales bacterium]|nr:uroporphyrinogen-III synthase [Terriglobales bacterium]
MGNDGFAGLRVLSLESRRAKEMGQLIVNNGGRPVIAPSMREVPQGPNEDELKFAAELQQGKYGAVIFLTGVGTRHLAQAIESVCSREQLVAALSRTKVVARGPKPVAVLREFGVAVTVTAPEPNTSKELLQALDDNRDKVPLSGQLVAIQEYGVPSTELYAELEKRGAKVFPVHVYKWEPPEDTTPLRDAISALSRGDIDVVMFTSSVQIHHLFQFAEEMKLREQLSKGLQGAVIASIGPTTSGTLRDFGINVDMEPSHPKMGFLVKEAAEQSAGLLAKKS